MSEYGILFLGDIFGRPGRQVVADKLFEIQDNPRKFLVGNTGFEPANLLFTIVNGENAASGAGITPDIVDDLLKEGVDAITLGNHWHNKREILNAFHSNLPMVRPWNIAKGLPGQGVIHVERKGVNLAVMNLCGRVFMDGFNDPFEAFDEIFETLETPHVFVDFHAEATSEKIAFGYHADGRASAVVGTHTHVTTADERVLQGGTAYITDVGMCGPQNSVIGVRKDIVLQRFKTGLPAKFEVGNEPGVISGVFINVQTNTGRATGICRLSAR